LFLNNFFTSLNKKFFNFFNSLPNFYFINFFKKINYFFDWFYNALSIAFNYFFFFIIVLLFIFYFNGSFFDISNFINFFLFNDCGYNLDLFEDWIISINYFYVLYTFILFFPNFFTFFINFVENFFFDNTNVFCISDVLLTYDYFNFNISSISIFTEIFTNLFFFKINFFISSLLNLENLDFNLNQTFLHNNPIFFYSGFLFLFSTLVSLILMSYLGIYGVFIINLITLFTLWISVIIYFDFFFVENNFFKIIVGKWFTLYGSFNVNFEFYVDSVSYSFMLLTITIAMFVYIYVYSYFRYDSNVERLILFINCFVISMVILVVSGNLFVFFLGWELIGLTSFLLINFWSSRISTLKSAFKAYTFNKFSDVSILISVILIILLINDVSVITLNSQIGFYKNYYITILNYDLSIIEIISFFFISAAFVKSAQFGTHIWLPDSMEAPVPASALIHSATLVSAGVFLLLRFSSLFEISTYAFYIIPFIGSFTAFFGGVCSLYQSDIKRILAYSTISHCGFLMVSYSLFIPEYTVLYLYIHGFFKAAVFLCAGNIIRFSRNYQDFKRMGLFFKYIPFEFFASFVCLINLCGLPFTMGFYIKHLLVIGLSTNNILYYFVFVNVIGGAISGLFYSYKFFFYSFLDVKKAKKIIYDSSSQPLLSSFFYSNTSLASNITITSLILVSYYISLKLFNVFLNKNSIGSGLDIYSIYYSSNLEFIAPSVSFLENISYFNWLILLLIISLIFVSWRRVYKSYYTLNTLFSVVLFFLFFFIFIQIL